MDPNGYAASFTYTVKMIIMAKCGDNGERFKSEGMFVGRASQCIYSVVQWFLTDGNEPWYFSIYGFWTILIFRGFWSFLE